MKRIMNFICRHWWWIIGGLILLLVVVLVTGAMVVYTTPVAEPGMHEEEPVATLTEEEASEEEPAEEPVEETKEEVAPGFTLRTASVDEADPEGFYLRGQAMGNSGPGEVWFEVTKGSQTTVSSSMDYPENLPGEWDIWYPAQPGEYKMQVFFQPEDGPVVEGEKVNYHFSP